LGTSSHRAPPRRFCEVEKAANARQAVSESQKASLRRRLSKDFRLWVFRCPFTVEKEEGMLGDSSPNSLRWESSVVVSGYVSIPWCAHGNLNRSLLALNMCTRRLLHKVVGPLLRVSQFAKTLIQFIKLKAIQHLMISSVFCHTNCLKEGRKL
jgi:hypothetical protein